MKSAIPRKQASRPRSYTVSIHFDQSKNPPGTAPDHFLSLSCGAYLSLGGRKKSNKKKLCSGVVIQPETSSLMSEQANQLHHPPVMFNERKITFYTFLHSCDKHVVFFLRASHWDLNHNRVMRLWW